MIIYPNNLKNWEFDKKSQGKATRSKINFSSCLGIYSLVMLASLLSSPLIGAATTPKKETTGNEMPSTPPPLLKASPTPSYISIPINERAMDLQQAYDLLKKEKSAGKVYFQLSDTSTISNIIDMTLLPNNSLILFRYNTNNQGIRLQIVKVEDIVGLSYY